MEDSGAPGVGGLVRQVFFCVALPAATKDSGKLIYYVKTCTELVIWVWLNAINKLTSYLHSGSADICVRSHVIALALSLGVPGKPCQLLTLSRPSIIGSLLYHIKIRVHFNKS